jgi:hypothetical protein
MQRKSRSIAWLLFSLISTPLVQPEDQGGPRLNRVGNRGGTRCVKAAAEQSVIQNPLYFELQVKCPDQIELGWELRDDSGKVLDQDPAGSPSLSTRPLHRREFSPCGTLSLRRQKQAMER